jgi:chemotaxis regulatin CheY-phosphate phosphatase CheZ
MNELSHKKTETTPDKSEDDYRLIEDALLQNPRGRWFLEEFLNRNRPEDTQKLLEAIRRIESNLEQKNKQPADDIDPIRMSIIEMSKAIAKTREEIKSIKPEREEDNQLISASEELGAIVESTEFATNTILEAAEEIQEAAWILREAGALDATCDIIDNKTTDIYTACSFQDITGQRTTKVVQALCYIENRVNAMIDIWGLDETDSTAPRKDNMDNRADAHLLNGPAKLGDGLEQGCVDDMLNSAIQNDSKSDNLSEGQAEEEQSTEVGQSLADSLSFDSISTSTEESSQSSIDEDFNFDAIDTQSQPHDESIGSIDSNEEFNEVEEAPDTLNLADTETVAADATAKIIALAESSAENEAFSENKLQDENLDTLQREAPSDDLPKIETPALGACDPSEQAALDYVKRRCSTQTAAIAAKVENDIQFDEPQNDFNELASIAEGALSDGPLEGHDLQSGAIEIEDDEEDDPEFIDLINQVKPADICSLNPALVEEKDLTDYRDPLTKPVANKVEKNHITKEEARETLTDLKPEELTQIQEDTLLS